MKLPELMPSRPSRVYEMGPISAAQSATGDVIEPAGCCHKICLPVVGCTCTLESPLCPG